MLLGRSADTGYEEELRRRIAAHGLQDRVIFEGHKEDVGAYYHAADVFVLPSYLEGCSLALAEAFYSGIPIVATAVGSAVDLRDAENVQIVGHSQDIRTVSAERYQTLVWELDSNFIGRLAETMVAAMGKNRMNRDPQQLRLLEREHTYAKHAQLFESLGAPH